MPNSRSKYSETSVELVHWSKEPFELGPRRYIQSVDVLKPQGLWLSHNRERGWRSWCMAEKFRLDHLSCCTVFEVNLQNTVVIDSREALIEFCTRYCDDRLCNAGESLVPVNWRAVARDHDGIYIPNYHRNWCNHLWWYAIDCDCGCWWNTGVLTQIGAQQHAA